MCILPDTRELLGISSTCTEVLKSALLCTNCTAPDVHLDNRGMIGTSRTYVFTIVCMYVSIHTYINNMYIRTYMYVHTYLRIYIHNIHIKNNCFISFYWHCMYNIIYCTHMHICILCKHTVCTYVRLLTYVCTYVYVYIIYCTHIRTYRHTYAQSNCHSDTLTTMRIVNIRVHSYTPTSKNVNT